MTLTVRQEQVARLIAAGTARSRIAGQLGVSVSSVDKTTRILKTKFGAENQLELVVRCNSYFQDAETSSPRATTGSLHRLEAGGPPVEDDPAIAFAGLKTFDALFATLLRHLEPFRITHATYSHITEGNTPGSIMHLATSWSFPVNVTFDLTIPPEENFAFKHAMASWEPAPLDLEEMVNSELYSYLPANIRRQNDVFRSAGLSRGVTYVLPGPVPADRLVLSVLMQHATRAEFDAFVADKMQIVYRLLMQFRNAHTGLAKPVVALNRHEKSVMEAFCDGKNATEIATAMEISRRAVDRILHQLRVAYGVPSNTAAATAFIRDKIAPPLPF